MSVIEPEPDTGGGSGGPYQPLDPDLTALAALNTTLYGRSLLELVDQSALEAELSGALALLAPIASPVFTGTPEAPTPAASDNDTSIATTAFVQDQKTIDGKGFVNHGAIASTARPAHYASVEWFGTVEPDNWVDGDTWNDPS